MQDETCIIIFALGMLTMLMCWALFLHINGAVLSTVIGVLAYVAGYKYKAAKDHSLTGK